MTEVYFDTNILKKVNIGDTFTIGGYVQHIMKFIDIELSKRALRAMYYGPNCTVCIISSK